eukprot:3431641-Rhodomonas_salina.3
MEQARLVTWKIPMLLSKTEHPHRAGGTCCIPCTPLGFTYWTQLVTPTYSPGSAGIPCTGPVPTVTAPLTRLHGQA